MCDLSTWFLGWKTFKTLFKIHTFKLFWIFIDVDTKILFCFIVNSIIKISTSYYKLSAYWRIANIVNARFNSLLLIIIYIIMFQYATFYKNFIKTDKVSCTIPMYTNRIEYY